MAMLPVSVCGVYMPANNKCHYFGMNEHKFLQSHTKSCVMPSLKEQGGRQLLIKAHSFRMRWRSVCPYTFRLCIYNIHITTHIIQIPAKICRIVFIEYFGKPLAALAILFPLSFGQTHLCKHTHVCTDSPVTSFLRDKTDLDSAHSF